jgi:hypothetical protein
MASSPRPSPPSGEERENKCVSKAVPGRTRESEAWLDPGQPLLDSFLDKA